MAKKSAVPSSFQAQAQAETQVKYGPQLAALGQLLVQAMQNYSSQRAQALAGANIMAQAARHQGDVLIPALTKMQAGLPQGAAGSSTEFARQELGLLPGLAAKYATDNERVALAGGQYQVGQALKQRNQSLQNIGQQITDIKGQAGANTAAVIGQLLGAQADRILKARTVKEQITAADLRNQASITASGERTQAEIQARKDLEAWKLAHGVTGPKSKGGSGSGPGGIQWLSADQQATAQRTITHTMNQINQVARQRGVTRGEAAQMLRDGVPAKPVYIDPEDPNGTRYVDQATGIVYQDYAHFVHGQPMMVNTGQQNAQGQPKLQVRRGVQRTFPAIAAVDPVYTYAALDRLRDTGYSPQTVKAMHEAGIKVMGHTMPPKTRPTVGHGTY